MQVIHAGQVFPANFSRSLFLAGPTPRRAELRSWRPEAIAALADAGFDGVIFVPEPADSRRPADYDAQIEWELDAMRRSDLVAFWVPADKEDMPALTTRVEFGLQANTGKAVLGIPRGAYKTAYIEKLADITGIPRAGSLGQLSELAMRQLGPGAERAGAETLVPLEIWRARHFRDWYGSQRAAGHALVDVPSVEWTVRSGSKRYPLFCALHVVMRICGEERLKSNERVIIRPSISSVAAYCPGADPGLDRFVLVKEYRSCVMNPRGFVFELPGGASLHDDEDPIELGLQELREETGISLTRDRVRPIAQHQIAANLVANRALLLEARLSGEEMEAVERLAGTVAGNVQSESERTELCVRTRREIMEGDFTDWSTRGMLAMVGR